MTTEPMIMCWISFACSFHFAIYPCTTIVIQLIIIKAIQSKNILIFLKLLFHYYNYYNYCSCCCGLEIPMYFFTFRGQAKELEKRNTIPDQIPFSKNK